MRHVEFGRQGWIRVNGLSAGGETFSVVAKTKEWEGRRIVIDLVVGSNPWAPGVTSAVLKAVPIGWIESTVNTPEALRWLSEHDPGDPEKDATAVALQERRSEHIRESFPFVTQEVPKLARPDGTNPDGFYRLVAAAYVAALAQSNKPAAVLAEQAEVPVPTVHRWIAEARRRGFLPPARKGRAG